MQEPKKFVLVGTGGRAEMFIEAIAKYRDNNRLCGLCDISQVRLDYYNRRLCDEWNHPRVPTCKPPDLQAMLYQHRPDAVIVTSGPDSTHHEYILAALASGCDAITEKPMTIDAEKCRAIMDAAARSDRRITVCFNYRWQAAPTQIKRLLSEGAIGAVKSVTMEYALDTSHGADYFRRWHAQKENSGGLLVHKATHHFDLVNWWLDAIPAEVFAWGGLVFYGKENAVARGDEALTQYPRYTGADHKGDPFALELDSPQLRELYLAAEAETGYIRNRNVFSPAISIEDTMSVLVKYRSGIVLNYSLNAFCPTEGYRVIFNGDRGRLEYAGYGASHLNVAKSNPDDAASEGESNAFEMLRVHPHFSNAYDVEIPFQPGPHGGGDLKLVEQLFAPNPPAETLGRRAGCEQGAASIAIGIAANQSMKSGGPVRISDFVFLKPEAASLSELAR